MADELDNNLAAYKLQLQQVEAALTADPDNEDLLKLQKDLQEVIDLTEELVGNNQPSSVGEEEAPFPSSSYQWNIGDKCLAPWSRDQQYYTAVIEDILEDGSCSVVFDNYKTSEVTKITLLKPLSAGSQQDNSDSKKPRTKKDLIVAQREYKKKKAQKKIQRLKQKEEEHETDKNKWINFNARLVSKSSKGLVKKSIFASPETIGGRVGIGTCGVSGKPMTHYQLPDKWKKQS